MAQGTHKAPSASIIVRRLRRTAATGLLAFAASHIVVSGAEAQTASPSYSPARPTSSAGSSPAPKAAAKTAAAKSDTTAAPAATGEAALRQRIEQLEEQLVEMQVTVGTLDSLAKGGSSSSSGVYRGGAAADSGGADAGRIAALETQVRALATQVDQLAQQVRQSNARGGAGQAAAGLPAAAPVATANAATAGQPDNSDPIGRLVYNGSTAGNPAAGVVPQGAAAAPSMAAASASDASSKQAYESAYGYLLQQDFAAAEGAFDDFLKRYPSDPLAGNAQYWLGETFFARGQFKPAAAAFLKVSQSYPRSAKAPDSLLKLAMSLDKLGAKDAACASYADLNAKFPNAPGHVKNRADTERRRLGCA